MSNAKILTQVLAIVQQNSEDIKTLLAAVAALKLTSSTSVASGGAKATTAKSIRVDKLCKNLAIKYLSDVLGLLKEIVGGNFQDLYDDETKKHTKLSGEKLVNKVMGELWKANVTPLNRAGAKGREKYKTLKTRIVELATEKGEPTVSGGTTAKKTAPKKNSDKVSDKNIVSKDTGDDDFGVDFSDDDEKKN